MQFLCLLNALIATVPWMQKYDVSDEYTKDTMYAPYLEYFQPFLCSNAYALCFWPILPII